MSETTTRALRANAFTPTNVRRLTLEITDEPTPTRAQALEADFWKSLDVQPRDVVTLVTKEGELNVLIGAPADGGGWNVRPL